MNEDVIREGLMGLFLGWYSFEDTALSECESCKTFKEAGLLTNDTGIVLTMKDGSQFQLTVKQTAKYREGYYEDL